MSSPNNPKHDGAISKANRFTRGRGSAFRGNKRPYFYRRVNWRKISRATIPNAFPIGAVSGSSSAISGSTSESLQRREFFTAPMSVAAERVQIIPIVNPIQYPGWRLYFPTETYTDSSLLVTQVKAFERHIINHPNMYALKQISKQRWFLVDAQVLIKDDEFVSSWTNFTQQLKETSNVVLSCLGLAMHGLVTTMSIENAAGLENNTISDQYRSRRVRIRKMFARPVGFFNANSIADITPESCDKLFVLYGRVDGITAVAMKCTWVAFKCKRCGHEQAIRQGDYYPTKPLQCSIQCNSKRNFIELRSSPYTTIDCMQMIQLQDMGLNCNLGSPHRIDIELREDLVDLVCSGSEIKVTGVLKIKPLDVLRNQEVQKGSIPNIYMQAVSIVKYTNTGTHHLEPTQKDLEIVKMITREPNYLRLLVQSIAPEMCGYEMVKFALLLSLFGGSGSQLHDESDIHILVVGDPGVGKSNLLQNAANISAVGNLVSAKSPTCLMPTNQHMKLPSGFNNNFIGTGSVLASNAGHSCIDDMDKIASNQETLIHVIQTKLLTSRSTSTAFNVDARSSVIAAVNPSGGHYDSTKLLRENVRLSPSLLSLFHLVFVLCDKADKYRDNMLTDHVKALHSGMKKVLSIPPKYSMELETNFNMPTNVEMELDERLKVNCDEQLDLLPTILLRKYIGYARQNIKPLLTKEAFLEIQDFYLGLRSEKNDEGRILITTRQLEALIRLTQARARVELCSEATKQHARDVIELVRHSFTDASVVDRFNSTLNGSVSGTSHGSQVKKFIQMLELRSNALGRNIFEFEELKDMATHAGIKCGVANLVEIVNLQGYLLKKGPNLYEVRIQ